jgi:hypothetical protein
MTDGPFGITLTGGSTQEVPLTPAYRSVLEDLRLSTEWEVAKNVGIAAATTARGLGSGLQSDVGNIRKGWKNMAAAKADLEEGIFLRYAGPLRLVRQSVEYKRLFSFRKISIEFAFMEIPGGLVFGLPSAELDGLSRTSGEHRSSPDGVIRSITTTGEVDFTKHSLGVLALRGPDGATIFRNEDMPNG